MLNNSHFLTTRCFVVRAYRNTYYITRARLSLRLSRKDYSIIYPSPLLTPWHFFVNRSIVVLAHTLNILNIRSFFHLIFYFKFSNFFPPCAQGRLFLKSELFPGLLHRSSRNIAAFPPSELTTCIEGSSW